MSSAPPGRLAGRCRWRGLALPALLVAFAILAGLYSLATPIFEGPDEIWHFAFASYLADGGGLPVLSVQHPNLLLRNAAHPPLYFLPVAALIAPTNRTDFPASFRFNLASPSITPGSHSDRPNLLIHGRNEDFPYRQTTLAVHLGRLVSVALGVVTLAGVWVVARLLAPAGGEWLPLATVAVAAFLPQFVYGSAIINNDALAAAGGAWTLAALLAWMRRRSWQMAALSGLALGVTLLSKIGMVAVAPLPAVAIGLVNWDLLTPDGRRRTDWKTRVKPAIVSGLLMFGVAAVVAGWWYARNWLLYGDPLAWQVWQVLAGVGRPTPTPAQFASDMAGLFGTFWADFGLRVDRQWSWVFALLVLGALGGWVRRLARHEPPPIDAAGLLLGVITFGLLLASAVRYSLQITDIHGRLLYPAIAVAAFWLVTGLLGWGPRVGRVLVGGTIAGLFLTTLLVPFVLIGPAYARPVVTAAQVPNSGSGASATFGGQVQLVGYRLLTPRVKPGGAVQLVTYWRSEATAPHMIGDLRASMALIQPNGHPLGHTEVLLGSSVYPSSEWTPGDIVVADLAFTAPADADLPSVAALWLSVLGADEQPLASGADTHLVLGQVALSGAPACTPATPTQADFGGLVKLLGYTWAPGRLTLCWQAEQAMLTDYTVFVHVTDASGQMLANADGQPRNGLYPTSAWAPGEVVADTRQLSVPPGASIQLGLYRLDTGQRMTLASGDTQIAISP